MPGSTLHLHSRRRRLGVLAGLTAGVLAGTGVSVIVNAPNSAHSEKPAKALDISHNPPLLTPLGQPVELDYQITCPYEQNTDHECQPSGAVHLQTLTGVVDLPLTRGRADRNFLYYATVPASYLAPGLPLKYWATFSDATSGGTGTSPAAGAVAPDAVWATTAPLTVTMPAAFTAPRAADVVEAAGAWGQRTGQFGLEPGKEASTIGASSFDVAPDGTVVVLDQINHRVQRFRNGNLIDSVALAVSGARADFAIGNDGNDAVLEEVPSPETLHPTLKRFTPDGVLLSSQSVADAGADMVRSTAGGLAVHAVPSDQWQPLLDKAGALLSHLQIGQLGTPDLSLGTSSLVVKVLPDEVRVAQIADGAVLRSWRITSTAWLGEYQVATLDGSDLVLVQRQFSDTQSQFRYLRVSPTGATQTFTLDPAEWAETAPMSRVRFVHGALYQARSSADGLSIVRYNLGS
jgi:hypothetical protein